MKARCSGQPTRAVVAVGKMVAVSCESGLYENFVRFADQSVTFSRRPSLSKARVTGPATTYGYDQAGNLISVERPKEGETLKIEQSYAYNGDGLRASETISGSTRYLTWQTAGVELPAILTNESTNFIYGPGNLPVEQISSTGTVLYLHHDQQGSTRLLTGSAGAKKPASPTMPTATKARTPAQQAPHSATTPNTPAPTPDSFTSATASTTPAPRSSLRSIRAWP